MPLFKTFIFGNGGIEYLKKVLADGSALSKLLLREVKLKGKIYTFLPDTITTDEAHRFDEGGKIKTPIELRRKIEDGKGERWIMEPVTDNLAMVLPDIEESLLANAANTLILENALARAGDECASNDPTTFFHDDEVYHIVVSFSRGDSLENVIRRVTSYRFLGIITSFPHENRFENTARALTHDQLKVAARNTSMIICGAYDGEGYLLWRA